MNLKVGSKVFYPSHGAGWVKKTKKIKFNGEEKDYYEFELINNQIGISTPVENIDSLGVRSVDSQKKIKDKITALKKKSFRNVQTADFNALISLLDSLETNATIESFVEMIQYCNFIKKEREKDGRLIPVTIEKKYELAVDNIVGELAVSAGVKLDTAYNTFETISGLKKRLGDK